MHYDAIVLGTGGVGSAALFHLAKRGVRVLGIDAYPPGHAYGSSHGETRAIRQAYFEHPSYVPLVLESYRLWTELEDESKTKLLYKTGLLQIGPEEGEVLQGVFRSAEEYQLAIERLTANDVHKRFSQFQLRSGMIGAYERNGGFVFVEAAVKAHIALARGYGAQWSQASVQQWKTTDNRVEVQTAESNHTAEQLIICGGAWTSRLVAELDIQLQVLAKQLRWYPADPSMELDAGCPVFLFEEPNGVFYGFPAVDGRIAKLAEHSGGIVIGGDPSNYDRQSQTVEQERIDRFANDCLTAVQPQVAKEEVCFYTMSPDQHFIVGRLPEIENVAHSERVLIACGLSGHGFKFTPVLGKALADLAIDSQTQLPIEFLSPSRFA